jgi:hypothetical protein
MEFASLLELVADEPVFETGLLLSGDVNPASLRRQLSRWVRSGWLHQLRRGLYALAPPYRKVSPHPFEVANRMQRGSYVSLHSALEHYGLIPERVERVISVGGGRPGVWETPLGTFEHRHLDSKMMTGYRSLPIGGGRKALVATPEKALLDLVYLVPGGDAPEYLEGLRLQNLEGLDLDRLHGLAEELGKPKLRRAAREIERLAREEAEEFVEL